MYEPPFEPELLELPPDTTAQTVAEMMRLLLAGDQFSGWPKLSDFANWPCFADYAPLRQCPQHQLRGVRS